MKQHFLAMAALWLTLLSLLPWGSAGRLAGNHNQTLLRD